MTGTATTKSPGDPALSGPATAYRLWSNTARYHKGAIDRLTKWSLYLAIGGAVFATAGEQISLIKITDKQIVSQDLVNVCAKALGVLGTVAVTLAAYLSQRAQADNRVGIWTRSRAAAESLKSLIFLYRAGVQPFDGPDRAAQIGQRVEKAIQEMHDVEPRQPDSAKALALDDLTVETYISERAYEQVIFYEKRAGEHQVKADRCRAATSVLMGVGALLALASAGTTLSVWAPVVATITASIAAYLKNQQYQILTATYTATALRLRLLLDEWKTSGKTDADKAERTTFILRCEETMSAENGSWSALWARK
jgi:SMODS and SLOG-associating 2TM effector domain 1/SMODS and SLOG-associating 2TM effector domain 3